MNRTPTLASKLNQPGHISQRTPILPRRNIGPHLNYINEFNQYSNNPWENIAGNNRSNTAYVYRNIYDETSTSADEPIPVRNKNGTINLNATYKKYSYSPEKLLHLEYYGLKVKDGKFEKISPNHITPNEHVISRWHLRSYRPVYLNKKIGTQRKLKLSNVEKEPLMRKKEKNYLLREKAELIIKKENLVKESESINKKIKNIENKLTKL
jgi:hypothetical protein